MFKCPLRFSLLYTIINTKWTAACLARLYSAYNIVEFFYKKTLNTNRLKVKNARYFENLQLCDPEYYCSSSVKNEQT